MKALILAGGFGTRLKDVVKDIPKPMALIAGKPFLEYQIRFLNEQGINEIILAVHYMSDKIKSYFGDGSRLAINTEITYSEEEIPLGTAGAIKKAQKYLLGNDFIVLNGDSYSQIDIQNFFNFHKRLNSNFSIALTKLKDGSEGIHYGSAMLEGNNVMSFMEKSQNLENIISMGIYLFNPKIFDYIEGDKKVSLETEILPRLASERSLFGYNYGGFFIDIGRPETYKQFKHYLLKKLFLLKENTVRQALERMNNVGIDLILVVDEQKKLLGTFTENKFREYILKGGNGDDLLINAISRTPITANVNDPPEKITDILLNKLNRLPILDNEGKVVDIEFRVEKLANQTYPSFIGKSPLRISFAGGGTDLPYFFEKYGGIVINATIDKYSHVLINKRGDSKIIINSDNSEENIFSVTQELKYDGNHNLVKAVTNIVKPPFGFELNYYSDIPHGRGLGSSASLAVLIARLLLELKWESYDDKKIAQIAYQAETKELKIRGGWQDQYAAVTGGFNFMEFSAKKQAVIYPLRLKEDTVNELNERLLLCYVGKSHFSDDIHSKQEKSFSDKNVIPKYDKLKEIAVKIKDSLLKNEIDEIGGLLHQAWECKKSLEQSISGDLIDKLYEIGLKNGAYGGKLLGAGGGGYILFFYSPKKRNQLVRTLTSENGEIMNFNFENKGTSVWRTKSI